MSDDPGEVYCVHCIYFVQHMHPFYPDEVMKACLSNPSLRNNFMHRKVEYADPAEKNKDNHCSEFKARWSIKIRLMINKILKFKLMRV